MAAPLGIASSSPSLSFDLQGEETTAIAAQTSDQLNSIADGATLESGAGLLLLLHALEAHGLPPLQHEAPTAANAVPTTTTSSIPTHQQPLDEISITVDSNTDGDSDSESCAICLEDLAPGEEVCALPRCNHAFHDGYLYPWLRLKATCPLCRDCVFERQSSDDNEDSYDYFDTDGDDDDADDTFTVKTFGFSHMITDLLTS